MHFYATLRIVGRLLMLFSITMVTPLVFSYAYDDGIAPVFWRAFFITFTSGLVISLALYKYKAELRIKDGFLATVLFYVALGSFGSIPLIPALGVDLSYADAIFESFSGLTTTGATVLTGIDALPRSILYYRQQLQWLGGMGIIVLAVAILPMLGIGGMQLYRAETPGPVKDSKLTPRIKQTALALWSIYVGLTAACMIAYAVAGMDWFDALCHSFSTVAIGGFSTHDASIGFFDNAAIESVAIFFMVVSGVNFSLHYFTIAEKTLVHYWRDSEVRFYGLILGVAALICTVVLILNDVYSVTGSFRFALFQVVSIFTTTGFGVADFSAWPHMVPFMIFFGAFTGACAGSTGGGLKVIRVLLIVKQGLREIHRLIHPNAIFPIKLNDQSVANNIIDAVWGFFSVYVLVFLFVMLFLMATGLDFVTAFSAMGACLNNLGPGLGAVTYHYGDISTAAKYILCIAMILGRLEIFTLLVLFTPMFWQK